MLILQFQLEQLAHLYPGKKSYYQWLSIIIIIISSENSNSELAKMMKNQKNRGEVKKRKKKFQLSSESESCSFPSFNVTLFSFYYHIFDVSFLFIIIMIQTECHQGNFYHGVYYYF